MPPAGAAGIEGASITLGLGASRHVERRCPPPMPGRYRKAQADAGWAAQQHFLSKVIGCGIAPRTVVAGGGRSGGGVHNGEAGGGDPSRREFDARYGRRPAITPRPRRRGYFAAAREGEVRRGSAPTGAAATAPSRDPPLSRVRRPAAPAPRGGHRS
jgi:hypothetical protein